MIKDDIIFCQFRNDQERDYDIQVVVKVVGDRAFTNDGYKIDAQTGIEENKKFGVRIWEVVCSRNKDGYARVKEYKDAKKWHARISEFPELMIRAYRACMSNELADNRTFFHELDGDQYELLAAERMEHIQACYRKPVWCGHPFALSGWFGCQKLLRGQRVDEGICRGCGCFVNPGFGEYFKRLRLISGATAKQLGSYLGIKDYKDIENGHRSATYEEIKRLIELYCLKDWYFADILEMICVPTRERDRELDARYRDIIQSKLNKYEK